MTTIVNHTIVTVNFEYGGQAFSMTAHCKNSTEVVGALEYMRSAVGYFDEETTVRISGFDADDNITALEWHF